MTLRIKLAQWKHRLLRACSQSYRDHDVIVSERDRFRTMMAIANAQIHTAELNIGELKKQLADVGDRLKLAIAAQENATQQLIAERALRQAADERAERYHGELTDSLKSAANWSSKALNRKSMFSEADAPEEPATESKPSEPIRPKPFARQVAQQQTHAELMKMLEDMRNVGPEFTAQ